METTVSSAPGWSPDLTYYPATEAVPDALILQTSTVAGQVDGDRPAVRCLYVDDAAAAFVDEGAPIDEADPDLAEVLVFTGKVAQLVPVSQEQWRQDQASALLSDSVRRAVTKAGDAAYISQPAPTAPKTNPPAGLLEQPITDGGAITDNLDPLVDAVATIAAEGGQASHIVAGPRAWAELRKIKVEAGSAQSLLGAGTSDATPMLLGLPVYQSVGVPADTLLVADRTAVVSAVGPVEVALSEHAAFNRDAVVLRCVWRFGAAAVHPERVVKVTIGSGS